MAVTARRRDVGSWKEWPFRLAVSLHSSHLVSTAHCAGSARLQYPLSSPTLNPLAVAFISPSLCTTGGYGDLKLINTMIGFKVTC